MKQWPVAVFALLGMTFAAAGQEPAPSSFALAGGFAVTPGENAAPYWASVQFPENGCASLPKANSAFAAAVPKP